MIDLPCEASKAHISRLQASQAIQASPLQAVS